MNKQKIIRLLRNFHLLEIADYVRYLIELKRTWQSNRIFAAKNPQVNFPPPHLAYDAYAHTSKQLYWLTGREQAEYFGNIIKSNTHAGALSIFEWGCGPARVLRHMHEFLPIKSELFGSDYNPETISWCRRAIKDIQFELNDLAPPLPYESDQFDCLYCISVFTHLSREMHEQWISEISRVVKPSGLIILTTHGDDCTNVLMEDEATEYRNGKLVVRGNIQEGKRCYVAYHPPAYLKNHLLNQFEVILHIDGSSQKKPSGFGQDIWVIRNTK
jgi:SAM-dependent methyltransferase